jgi:hypothetical protein
MMRLRRMYARLLFVVVGIFRVFLVHPPLKSLFWDGALASPDAADIRWRHG